MYRPTDGAHTVPVSEDERSCLEGVQILNRSVRYSGQEGFTALKERKFVLRKFL